MQVLKVIQQHGKTLEEVATALGVTKGTFSVSINGMPKLKRLIDIANYLKCSPAEFFDDWDTAPENIHRIEAEPTPEEQQFAPSPADELPFKESAPTASVPASLICPHCGGAFVVEVRQTMP